MKGYTWILEGKTPRPAEHLEWGEWFKDESKRRLALDEIGDALVSTVFLGIYHGWGQTARPVLYETMVFGGALDGETARYMDYDAALVGHEEMVNRVRAQRASKT